MEVVEIIKSIIELLLINYILVLLDSENKISWRILPFCFAILTATLIAINRLELPYYMMYTLIISVIGFEVVLRRKLSVFITDMLLTNIIVGVIQTLVMPIAVSLSDEYFYQEIANSCLFMIVTMIIIVLQKTNIIGTAIINYYQEFRKYYLLAFVCIASVMIVLSQTLEQSISQFLTDQISLFSAVIIVIIFSAQLVKSKKKENKAREECDKYKEQSENYYVSGLYDKQLIKDHMMKEHEYKNQLSVIYSLANDSRDQENKTEIHNYIDELGNKKRSANWVGTEKIISALLAKKAISAAEMGVALNYKLNKNIKYDLSKNDLVTLITNMIDNAIEYTAGLKSSDFGKDVNVTLYRYAVIVSNPVKSDLRIEDFDEFLKAGISTKDKDKDTDRGYGLPIIKNIVADNKLTMELDIDKDNGIFTIAIGM